jgi:hypothetical protein
LGERGNRRLIRQYFERLATISEHGIVHGITTYEKKYVIDFKAKNGSLTIEWE